VLQFDALFVAKRSRSGLLQDDAGHACTVRTALLDCHDRFADSATDSSGSDPAGYSVEFFPGSYLRE
jgi:hypothetical protein